MTLTFVGADFIETSDFLLVKRSSHYNRYIQESVNIITNLLNYLQMKQEEQNMWYIVMCRVHKPKQHSLSKWLDLASVHLDAAPEHIMTLPNTYTLNFVCFFLSSKLLSRSQLFLWAQMLLAAAKSMRAWLSRGVQEEKRRQTERETEKEKAADRVK